ncbi:MAG: Gldg family protein [Bacteroidetes bacterium]|nr:Gldg family protein [Bacteroidota bacterium]
MMKNIRRTQSLVRLGIVLAILVLLNFVSVRLFDRIDMTRSGLFTLADASKRLMQTLDDKVTVKAYFTEDLPAPYNSHRRMLLDQLNEYRAYAKGNFQFEFIDPSGEEGEREAQQQGIAPVQVQVVKEDKFEVKRAYMGMVFLYEDRKEVIPVIQNTGTLEYEISSTVHRLTNRTRHRIGFLSGSGSPGLEELSRAQELLRKQYDLVPVDVAKGAAVPPDIGVLFVIAPTSPLPEPVKFQIDQYLMRGGKVAFLLNRVEANLQNQYGRALELNLDDMLQQYGLRINPDLVRDLQCASVTIVQQQYGFNIQSQVPFPYLPLVNTFSEGNMMVKDLQNLVMFFASSIDTVGVGTRGLRAEILARSSKQSGRQTGMFIFDPLRQYTREEFTESSIPLGAVVEGSFTSLYEGKPAPVDTTPGATPPPAAPATRSPETRVVLLGDGDFARDQFMGGSRDNMTLFANMVDYLMDDTGLITIRTKEATLPPLEQLEDGTKKMIKYANLALPPLLVLGYGALRWRMRKARKKALEVQ